MSSVELLGVPLSLQVAPLTLILLIVQTIGVEQGATAAMAALVKVHKLLSLKVAVRVFTVPSAGMVTPVKVYDVAPMLLTATVAEASPLNTKLPVVGALA